MVLSDYAEVLFPSGARLPVISLPTEKPDEYEDPFNSGTHLFSSDDGKNILLSTNFKLGEFVDPWSLYFRLSPLLVDCLQGIRDQADEAVIIDRCYLTKSTAEILGNGSTAFRTGKAAVVRFSDSSREVLLTEVILLTFKLNCRDVYNDCCWCVVYLARVPV